MLVQTGSENVTKQAARLVIPLVSPAGQTIPHGGCPTTKNWTYFRGPHEDRSWRRLYYARVAVAAVLHSTDGETPMNDRIERFLEGAKAVVEGLNRSGSAVKGFVDDIARVVRPLDLSVRV